MVPAQIFFAVFELGLLLAGAWGLARAAAVPAVRASLFGPARLPHWAITGVEVVLLLLLIVLCGFVGQAVAARLLFPLVARTADVGALQIVVAGAGMHGAALLGWPVFRLLRGHAHADYGAPSPATLPAPRLRPAQLVNTAVLTLVLALPVVALASLAWRSGLNLFGLPDEPQDLIALFAGTHSPWTLAGLLVVACVIAPLNEELLFRGALFRYLRQALGRMPALALTGALFGILHGNWAGFLPLALLGVAFALAYERTGDLRVSIVAHGLFNLNTVAIVLSGLPNL